MQYHYGIDVGGTKIEIGVYNQNLKQLDSWRVATPTGDYQALLTALTEMITKADGYYHADATVGIGMPGILDKLGRVKSANVPCATGEMIAKDLQHKLSRNITIANDCRLFALSEANGGAADNLPVVYGAIIGTGAGGGLCIDGKLYKSTNNIAGEYGHIAASAELIQKYQLPVRQCGCGLTGCVESYVAGPALAWMYSHFSGKKTSTAQFHQDLLDGDTAAKQTFECYMDLLGSSFASLVLSYDPDMIVVGGGLSKMDIIIESLPKAINKHLFAGVDCPPVRQAKFGDASGVRGAAILGAQHG